MSQAPPPVPTPVEPITYGASSHGSGRPGIMTAIGLLSIVIGAFGILFNLGMGVTTFGVMIASQASRAFATVATPAPTQVVTPNDANAITPRERRAIINGLAQVRPLSPVQRRQLDAILMEAGRRMVFGSGPSLTPDVVAANISDHGRVAATKDGDEHDYFILGRGRLELFDDRAVFIPQDGTETVVAEAPEPDEGDPLSDDLETDADMDAADGDPSSATQPAGLKPRQGKVVIHHYDLLLK